MTVAQALFIVLRFLVIQALGWLTIHGVIDAATAGDEQFRTALLTIASGGLASLGFLLYRLWQSTLRQKIIDLLSHDEIKTVHVEPKIAAEIPRSDVIPTPPAQP